MRGRGTSTCGTRKAERGTAAKASVCKRPFPTVPRSAFRLPTSDASHDVQDRPPHLPRARGRPPSPRRRRHVRCRAETAVAASHSGRRAQPHSPGAALPPGRARRRARACGHGLGNKEDEKFKDIYGVVNEGKDGRTQLEDALAELGHAPADVRWVIDTHLHFDHAGGNTYRDPSGRVTLSFPKARYVVQRGELEFARHTNERTAASYLPPNFASVPFTFIDGEAQPLPGIRCIPTPGHVPYHQSVLVESGGERVCFLADLVPTSAHLPLPWIMGYDLEPLVTLESKRRLYARAEGEGWLLFFEHDPAMVAGRLGRDGKAFALVDPLRAG